MVSVLCVSAFCLASELSLFMVLFNVISMVARVGGWAFSNFNMLWQQFGCSRGMLRSRGVIAVLIIDRRWFVIDRVDNLIHVAMA